jgi:hypothetical protein
MGSIGALWTSALTEVALMALWPLCGPHFWLGGGYEQRSLPRGHTDTLAGAIAVPVPIQVPVPSANSNLTLLRVAVKALLISLRRIQQCGHVRSQFQLWAGQRRMMTESSFNNALFKWDAILCGHTISTNQRQMQH